MRRIEQRVVITVLAVAWALAACGGSGGADRPSAPTSSPPGTTHPTGTSPTPGTAAEPASPYLTAITEAGYPRDLLERGRVNVETTNSGDSTLRLTSRELIADYFRSPGPERRRSLIAPGATVDLQTQHGDVVDCTSSAPIDAVAVLAYTEEDGADVRSVAVPIGDTAILETVRTRACTARAFETAFDVGFGDPVIDGETFTISIELTRRAESGSFTIDRPFGTVLFGVERTDEHPSRIAPEEDAATVHLQFDVNRCDPHAVAETTRKVGLQLQVGVDGGEPLWIDIDTSALLDPLDEILDRCKARTGS